MNAVLSSLPLTTTFTDLIELSKAAWLTFVGELRRLHQDELQKWVHDSLFYLDSLVAKRTLENYQRLCIGLLSIYHFYINDITPIEHLINSLYQVNEIPTMQLAAYTIAKIAAALPPNYDVFARKHIDTALNLIRPEKNTFHSNLLGLFLLKELGESMPLTFLMHSADLPDQLWGSLVNSSYEIRLAASHVLARYLSILVKYQGYRLKEIFDGIFNKALVHLLERPNDCPQGILVILELVLKEKGHYFVNTSAILYNSVIGFIGSKGEVRASAISVIAQLTEVDPDLFDQTIFERFFMIIIKPEEKYYLTSLGALYMLIRNVPSRIPGHEAKMFDLCKKSISKKLDSAVFKVLSAIADFVPEVFSSGKFEVWEIVSESLFTEGFLELFPTLLKVIKNFWSQWSFKICEMLIELLQIHPEHSHLTQKIIALKILYLLPPLIETNKMALTGIVRRYLFSSSEGTRNLAPKALLHLVSSSSTNEIRQNLHQIIELATGDDSVEVRISCLKSFSEAHFPILASPIFLEFFSTIAHDVSPQVKSTCYEVLKNLRQYAPLGVDNIIRHSILDCFFALQCSNTLAMQQQIAEVLPSLVSASPELFQVYASTFIPIILNLLSQRFTPDINEVVNPLDPELRTQLALALVQTIRELVQNDAELLQEFLQTILPIYTTILGEWGDKRIKYEVLETISVLMRKDKTQEILQMAPQLLPTVFQLIETCNNRSLRVRALKFLGLCGAVSPKKFKFESIASRQSDENLPDLFLVGTVVSYNNYFVEYVYLQIRAMLHDKSLVNLKMKALSTVVEAMDTHSAIPGEFFSELVPMVIMEVKNSNGDSANDALILLQRLIFVAKQRIVKFVDDIMEIIQAMWRPNLVPNLLLVVAALVDQVGSDFTPYAGPLITNMLDIVSSNILSRPNDAIKCIPLLASICPAFPHLSQMLIPNVCNILMSDNLPKDVAVIALDSLRFLVQNTDSAGFSVTILRTALVFCVHKDAALRENGFQVLYSLMLKMGGGFNSYTHRTVEKLRQHRIMPDEFNQINTAMMTGMEVKITDFPFVKIDPLLVFTSKAPTQEHQFSTRKLLEHFDTSNITTPKHYQNWFNDLVLCFIAESPCISIRVCHELAKQHRPLAMGLFFTAFFSCWVVMDHDNKASISLKISVLLEKKDLPPDVLQCFARLCEYMDRAEKPLIISATILTPYYINAHCLALALHNEQERMNRAMGQMPPSAVNNIVQLYTSLGRSGAARALLHSPNDGNDWLLKLEQWSAAVEHYKGVLALQPNDEDGFVGFITASAKLRNYNVIKEREEQFTKLSARNQSLIANSFAEAFYFSHDYQKMLEYSLKSPSDSVEGHITRALANYMQGQNEEAKRIIDSAYGLISAQSSAMFGRRYETVYSTLLQCQVLYELHEMIETNGEPPTKQWTERLRSVDYMSEVWWPLIMIRMAVKKRDDDVFIGFLDLILHERKFDVFKHTLMLLFPDYNPREIYPKPLVNLLALKLRWATGERQRTITAVEWLCGKNVNNSEFPIILTHYVDWALALNGRSLNSLKSVNERLKSIIQRNRNNYAIWQRWASVNYHLYRLEPQVPNYAVEAIKGYMHCITFFRAKGSQNSGFADIVQLLSLFFATAHDDSVFAKTADYLKHIPSSCFIDTIPQLIAQLSHPSEKTVAFVQNILIEIGETDSQPLLFPLLVARMSPDKERSEAVDVILNKITKEHSNLMQQAKTIQTCLLQAAMTVFERFGNEVVHFFEAVSAGNKEKQDAIYKEMIHLINEPCSSFDRMFHQVNYAYIPHLLNPPENIDEFQAILREMLSNIDNFMERLTVLSVKEVCPEMSRLKELEVAVPGEPNGVLIKAFMPTFSVLGSKKRPRRATLLGVDGKYYKYLLKGNEDLRLDQRVMQFFHLINTQIRRDYSLSIDNVAIRDYHIVPLSNAVGLIQWVEGCDTFYNLVTEYRLSHRQSVIKELSIMSEATIEDTNFLTPIQRYEQMNEARIGTSNADIRKVFWLKSPSSDAWLERTTKFARSTALMSIVGYVLGLGDRHPSNFMIDRNTGDVVHIDFGDCFEVARNRVLYPEMIPFRLTRMIVSAFGSCGIEGEFRPVCERVMMLIRDNCNSLVSVLEIFVQEPITDGEERPPTSRIMDRIWTKMLGNDFEEEASLPVNRQVDRLIEAALDHYSLAKLYNGWCPLW